MQKKTHFLTLSHPLQHTGMHYFFSLCFAHTLFLTFILAWARKCAHKHYQPSRCYPPSLTCFEFLTKAGLETDVPAAENSPLSITLSVSFSFSSARFKIICSTVFLPISRITLTGLVKNNFKPRFCHNFIESICTLNSYFTKKYFESSRKIDFTFYQQIALHKRLPQTAKTDQ